MKRVLQDDTSSDEGDAALAEEMTRCQPFPATVTPLNIRDYEVISFDRDNEPPPKSNKEVKFNEIYTSLNYWEKITEKPWISATVEKCILNNTLGESVREPQFCIFMDGNESVRDEFLYSVTDGRTRIYFQTSSNISASLRILYNQDDNDCDETGWIIYLQEYKIVTQTLPGKHQATFVIQSDDYILVEHDELTQNMIYKRLKWLRWCEFHPKITKLMKTRLKLNITVPPSQKLDWRDVLLPGTPPRRRKNQQLCVSADEPHENETVNHCDNQYNDLNMPGPSKKLNTISDMDVENNFSDDVSVNNFSDRVTCFRNYSENVINQLDVGAGKSRAKRSKLKKTGEEETRNIDTFKDAENRFSTSIVPQENMDLDNDKNPNSNVDQMDLEFSPVITSTAIKSTENDKRHELQNCTVFDDIDSDRDSCGNYLPVDALLPLSQRVIGFMEDSEAEDVNNYIAGVREEVDFNTKFSQSQSSDQIRRGSADLAGNLDRRQIYDMLKSPKSIAQLITPLDEDRICETPSSATIPVKTEPDDFSENSQNSVTENHNSPVTNEVSNQHPIFTPLAVFVDPSKKGSAKVSISSLPEQTNIAKDLGDVYFQCNLSHDVTNEMCKLISDMEKSQHEAKKNFLKFLTRALSDCIEKTNVG